MRWSKIWLVMRREFNYNLGRRSYLFTAFGVPLFMMLIFFISFQLTEDSQDLSDLGTLGLVDEAGLTANLDNLTTDDVTFQRYESADAAREADLSGYLVIPAEYMTSGTVRYISEDTMPETLRGEISTLLRRAVAEQSGSEAPVARLADPADVDMRLLGEDDTLDIEQGILRFMVPIIFGFLIVFNIMIAAQFLMTGVSEEKENRILEILVTSLRPTELIAGKILGLGGLALLQVVFWVGAGLVMGVASGRADVLADISLDGQLIGVGIGYFIFSFALYASIMVGIGAATNAEQESRQIASIFVLMGLLPPLYGLVFILESPQGVYATVLALFPLTAAMTNLILIGMGESQTWLLLASFAALIISTIGVIWLSGVVFRVGMLMYGQRLGLKQVRQALRDGTRSPQERSSQ